MDLKLIQKLVRLMTRADVTEIEIDDAQAGLKVRLKRGQEPVVGTQPVVQLMGGGAPAPVAGYPLSAPLAPEPAGGADPDALPEGAEHIPSPMVGTFYRSPSPDSAPFVEIGGRIGTDEVLCIIEAMKVMNEIRAEVSGEVLAVLVENGEPVEFGQPLFLVKTA